MPEVVTPNVSLSLAAVFHRGIKQSLNNGQLVVIETAYGYTAFDADAEIMSKIFEWPCGEFILDPSVVPYSEQFADKPYKMLHLPADQISQYFTVLLEAGYVLAVVNRK